MIWDNTNRVEISAPYRKCPAFKYINGSMRFETKLWIFLCKGVKKIISWNLKLLNKAKFISFIQIVWICQITIIFPSSACYSRVTASQACHGAIFVLLACRRSPTDVACLTSMRWKRLRKKGSSLMGPQWATGGRLWLVSASPLLCPYANLDPHTGTLFPHE